MAAQLYGEFKQLFPENAVEYFISYYDQPEAYIPGKDIYVKDADINEQIDKLRLRATMSLMERRDVIVRVASVSCIYGLGVPEDYREALIHLETGMQIERDELLEKLITAHYSRNDIAFEREGLSGLEGIL